MKHITAQIVGEVLTAVSRVRALEKQKLKDFISPRDQDAFIQQFDAFSLTLRKEIRDILSAEETDGPGSIVVIAVDADDHQGWLKVTAVVEGGLEHRLNRMQGEFPNNKVTVLYKHDCARRNSAEGRIHRRLKRRLGKGRFRPIKWFQDELEHIRADIIDRL